MGYNTDFYKVNSKEEFEFMYSISGSSAPTYYDDLKSLQEVEEVFKEISQDSHVWFKWPVPWEYSTTSDDCVLFELLDRKWWQLWKPKNPIQVWHDTYYKKEDLNPDQMYFGKSLNDKNIERHELFVASKLRLFTLPKMRVKTLTKRD